MIRHNAQADPNSWGGWVTKPDGSPNILRVELREGSGSEWPKTLDAVSAFGLPPDARRVRLEVNLSKSDGVLFWYDGERQGETEPPYAGRSEERTASGYISQSVIDVFIGEGGTIRYGVGGKVKLTGLLCLGYWR